MSDVVTLRRQVDLLIDSLAQSEIAKMELMEKADKWDLLEKPNPNRLKAIDILVEKALLSKMRDFKKTIKWALDNCEECERQNLIVTDAVVGFWIEDLEKLILVSKVISGDET